jgi:hypothetical protein
MRGTLDNSKRSLQDLRQDYNRLFEKIKTDDKDLVDTLQKDFNKRQEQLDKMQDETQRLRTLRSGLQSVLGKTNPDGKYKRDQDLVEELRRLEQRYTTQQKELDTLRQQLQDSKSGEMTQKDAYILREIYALYGSEIDGQVLVEMIRNQHKINEKALSENRKRLQEIAELQAQGLRQAQFKRDLMRVSLQVATRHDLIDLWKLACIGQIELSLD